MKKISLNLAAILLSAVTQAAPVDIAHIWCGYWDNQNNNARLWISFVQKDQKVTARLQRSETLDDESPIDSLYTGSVKVTEDASKVVIKGGGGFSLEMKKPIAAWNKGQEKDSQFQLKSFGINVGMKCELQD